MNRPGGPVRVLHVDDEPDVADLTATFLERLEPRFSVETASNATEGLAYLAETDVDCVVSDYDMPGANGIEFLRSVRETDPDLPFLLFTGKGSEEVASDAISAGVTDYLQKATGTEQYAILANRVGNAVRQYRAERTAERSERRLRELAENTDDVLWMFSADWDEVLFVNSSFEAIWGESAGSLDGDPTAFLDGIHPEDRDRVRAAMDRLSGGEPVDVEYRVNASESYGRWVWVKGQPITDESGDVVRITGFVRDITDRKARESRIEALHGASRALMRAASPTAISEVAVETARDLLDMPINLVSLYDADRDVLVPAATTEEARALLGDPPVFTPGRSIAWDAFERGEERTFRDVSSHPDRLNPETALRSELVLPLADRGVIVIGSTETDAFDHTDVAMARILAANTEAALERADREQSLEQYRTLVEAVGDPMYVLDAEGTIEVANAAMASYLGTDRASIVGTHAREYLPPEDYDRVERELLALVDDPDRNWATCEVTALTEGDARVPAEINVAPLLDAAGAFVGSVGSVRDITDRQEYASKLEAQNEQLDAFASIVSHDLRNPLTVAAGRLALAREACDSEHLDAVAGAHERMRLLIDDLLAIARDGETAMAVDAVPLADAAREAWGNVQTADATLQVDADRAIRADRGRLLQLLENVFRNAVEHVGDDVGVRVGDLPDGFFVADDGPGIPAADRDRVFEMGYTGSSGGTGYGLTIVSTVADAHDWTVAITEGASGGARFEVTGVEFAR